MSPACGMHFMALPLTPCALVFQSGWDATKSSPPTKSNLPMHGQACPWLCLACFIAHLNSATHLLHGLWGGIVDSFSRQA